MSNPTEVQQLLASALAQHQTGRLAQADALYRQALSISPDQPEALHLLGVLWHQAGRSAQGAELIMRSVALSPTPMSLSNLGEVLRSLGRLPDAVAHLRRAVGLRPDWADAQGNLGMALMDMCDYDGAEKAFSRACQLAPQRGDFQIRLCRARDRQGDPHGAVIAGRRAVELQPGSAEAWSFLSLALGSAKKHDEAMEAADRAVTLAPNIPETHVHRGMVHRKAGRDAEGEAEYRKAIELSPNYSHAYRNLAAVLDAREDTPGSIAALEKAIELHPADPEGWLILANLRRKVRDYTGALAAANKSLELRPGSPEAHGARGFAYLHLGDYARGFADYEWRWRCDDFTTKPRDMPGPAWDGSDPTGRTILVHPEQGFGDTIQFARYIPMLAARGAKIIVETWAPLRTLMAGVKGVSSVAVCGVQPPRYDLHVALLSLPKFFSTTLQTVPADVPYFSVTPERLAAWKQRIDAAGPGLKIGLVWAGNDKPDPYRTCPLTNLTALGQVEGITLISLQNRNNPRAAEDPPPGMTLVDVAGDLKDFSETAAAMMNLDLIITIDTAAAHLAGALGRPTWTMLPWACDWRWHEIEGKCVWYPTMRLFRQEMKGDWTPVAQLVAEELTQFTRERKAPNS